mmetsp:Transcript_41268/g.129659  ORF Transcript_41268/g.129659 Transcript_41268/m.129659 type:complete len:114 (-) Transcript_41268:3863-4204(-)
MPGTEKEVSRTIERDEAACTDQFVLSDVLKCNISCDIDVNDSICSQSDRYKFPPSHLHSSLFLASPPPPPPLTARTSDSYLLPVPPSYHLAPPDFNPLASPEHRTLDSHCSRS